ncbi:MAG TPA: hypothetical protein VLM39_14185, partial [Ignavibacteriaceae bacterium]|nr:hypothetical protein [Ignavibacteriaceae bacterium]
MLKNYFKIALRTLFKHKVYTLINVSGFSVGIACCLTIYIFIQNELSFDNFHKNKENIFRLVRV